MKTGASYWDLIRGGEPYRLLFPLGTALGVIGVMLWPAHVWAGAPYPIESHAGIMIQGFLTCFVIGFLGTALPRLLDVRRLGLVETSLYAIGLLVVSALLLAGQRVLADAAFLLVLSLFMLSLLNRARFRRDIPPPGFVLVLLGMLCAWVGSVVLLIGGLAPAWISGDLYVLAKRLLYQGYLLLPIMGIGAFLLPRFFGLPNRQSFPESLRPPPGWVPRAMFAAACGGVVLVSFVLEAWGWWRWGFGLRALAILVYFVREVPVHQAAFGQGSLAWALRIALASLPLGYLAMAVLPQWQMALIHIVFITGFSLLTFTVATRVVLGHSGQEAKFKLMLKPVVALTVLLILAMLTRVSADWMPAIRLSHYAYASLCWAAAAAVWAWWIMPGVRLADRG